MRKSELLAKVFFYGEEIEEIDSEVFFNILSENKGLSDFKESNPYVCTDCLSFIHENYEYMGVSTIFNIGCDNISQTDSFYCRRQLISLEEMEQIGKLLNIL